MRYISKIAIGAMVLTLTTIFGCSGGDSGLRRLVAVQVTPSAPALAKGTSQQFKATGIYSDHTNDDMSSQVTWRTSDPSVAQVSPSGLATGTGVGNAVISAYVASFEGNQAIQVTPAELESIEISPPSNTAVGDRKQFTATGIFSDDTTQDLTKAVTWSSSSEAVVTISNSAGSEGLATFLRSGTASIVASFASVSSSVISGSTKVNVSEASLVAIHVSPVKPKMAVGTRIQLTAMGIYSDHTTQNLTGACTWESSDWDKGEVSNAPGLKGQVIAFSEGTITAKAIFVAPTGEKLEGSTEVEINAVTLETIQVKPTLPVIGIASTIQFTATGVFSNKTSQDLTNLVTWYSSNEDVAEVSNAAGSKGVAKGLTAGGTVISAAFKEVSGSTALTVTAVNISRIEITVVNPYAPFTPPPPITLEGAKVQLRATAIYEDNSIQDVTGAATWESDDNSIAVAANNPKGELTGLSAGSTAVKATFRGFVGTTGFTVRSTSEISEFQIIPPVAVIAEKTTQSFRVTAILTDESVIDLTTTSTWESADDSVAIPGNAPGGKGVFTGISAGDTVVQAFFSDREASAALKVTSAVLVEIQVTPIAPLMAPRSNLQFTALGIFSDGTTQNITTGATWHSSDESKLDVSNAAGFKGFGVAVAPGSVFARASLLGVTGETSVTVTGSELVSITVAPVAPKIAIGTKQQFNATGIFQDGTNIDLTNSATWYSSEESVAFVSNSRGRKGLAKGLSAGTSVIRAVFSGVSGTTSVEVTPATLVSIEVTPVQPVMVKGLPTQFTAIGIFSDTSMQNLTNDVTWRSSDSSAVVVSNVAGSKGQGFALKQASAVVTALYKEYPDDMIQ